MKTLLKLMTGALLVGSFPLSAQLPESIPGTASYCKSSSLKKETSNNQRFTGPLMRFRACGLNYTTASQVLGRRPGFPAASTPQPATFAISGIPTNAVIQAAFVWSSSSGNGISFNIAVVNPASVSFTLPAALVGSDADKCWGFAGSHTYRANVTNAISGNGNYQIGGFPTGSSNDIDGATMMVIWSEPNSNFMGEIIFRDGATVANSSTPNITEVLNGINVCATGATNARAFMGVGDMQNTLNNTKQVVLNGMPPINVTNPIMWNYFDVPTTLTANQASSTFSISNSGQFTDCLNLSFIGLYYRSQCTSDCILPCVSVDFNYSQLSGIDNPLVLSFTNLTTFTSGTPCWYVVDFGDGSPVYSGPTMPTSHTYPALGSYTMCVTVNICGSASVDCVGTRCKRVDVFDVGRLANPANESATSISVFPNPTSAIITINLTNPDPVQVRIVNMQGQEVAVATLLAKNQYQYDASALPSGIYFVLVQTQDGTIEKQAFIRD
jgi:hypothetical protein